MIITIKDLPAHLDQDLQENHLKMITRQKEEIKIEEVHQVVLQKIEIKEEEEEIEIVEVAVAVVKAAAMIEKEDD